MFSIPNKADAAFAEQAGFDSRDVDIIAAGMSGHGVIQGCAVSAQGVPNMTVVVAAGTVQIDGWKVRKVAAGNAAIGAADATNPRFDLVCVDKTGAKQVIAGAPATRPAFPVITPGYVVLAAIYVPATDAAIDGNQITDKRCVLPRRAIAPAGCVLFDTDFLNGLDANLTVNVNGTGAAVTTGNGDGDRHGVVVLNGGTSVVTSAQIVTSPTTLVLGSGACSMSVGLKAPATLSDATNRYTVRAGIMDAPSGNADSSDGVEFKYSDNVNGGKWQCACRAAGVETAADSGVAVTASTRYLLEIEVASDGSAATFYINGAQVAQIATNIPSAATGLQVQSINNFGAGGRTVEIDKLGYVYLPFNPY